jgi:glyoxylase-like metal-dependent hydrolase (beta-lactamase superfamily II)
MSAGGTLTYPHHKAPEQGTTIEIAPGILWTRIPLPFRLNHVNIFLIDDGDGWAVIDTGIANDPTRALWEQLLAGPLRGRRLTRLIVTHYHPDHIGLAGWLCERAGMPLVTTETSYLACTNISLSPGALDSGTYRNFYLRHGFDPDATGIVTTRGHEYLRLVTALPPTFRRIMAGDALKLGGRTFRVLTGDGHAAELAMLYCAEEKLFLGADQVLAKISPNISVWAVDPEGDPLALYLRSLAALKTGLDPEALVLPGHQLPFRGLHTRIDELVAHHEKRCAMIAAASHGAPKTAAELVPVIFGNELNPHEMSFAFGEVLAHINYMAGRGELRWTEPQGDVMRVVS